MLIRMLNLSPAEVAQLEIGLKQARERYDVLLKRDATAQTSADGTQLIVTVAPHPSEGGAIHDTLLSAFEQVLGPDRYDLFNAVSGDAFERSFDQFGLGTVSYTLSLKPVAMMGDRPIYKVVQQTTGPNGTWSTNNGSQWSVTDIAKRYPVTERFLSANLGQLGNP